MPTSSNRVDTPSIAYQEMMGKWQLVDDLRGGTKAMRAAGETWLPSEEKESQKNYQARLARSVLYNGLRDTINKTVARPFSEPVTLQNWESLPEQLQAIEEDADFGGSSLTQFAAACFVDGLTYGKFHILVDHPVLTPGLTLADERSLGARPYFCRVSPVDMIGWQGRAGTVNRDDLDMIRVRETRIEKDGDYGEKSVKHVRVYTPTEWLLYRQNDKGSEYSLIESGPVSLGAIPLVTCYFDRTGFMSSDPPFEDLAWLNLAHWQSMSDQRNLLRVARVPMLAASGLNEKEMKVPVVIGGSNILKSSNPDAKWYFVEHSGAALAAGNADMQGLEDKMEVLGLQPLVSRSGGVTATAKSIDSAKSDSNIHRWIRATETCIRQAYEFAADWINEELSDDFYADVHSEFTLSMQAAEDLQALATMHASGVLTDETYLREVQRRGILSDMVDPEKEAQAARDASPIELMMTPPVDDDPPEDEGEVAA